MRHINSVIVHCSDSDWGNVAEIDRWHKARGWLGCGYHWVILNCYPLEKNFHRHPDPDSDGKVELGRPEDVEGAHCQGHNEHSIGICLIGKHRFTGSQMFTLKSLIETLNDRFPGITVKGHYELDAGKTCPGFDMNGLRDWLNWEIRRIIPTKT